ncbi:MAG: hypothetical protein KAS12_01455 [Candidatus Aenigmarchaeota archaeon]|nr:hypothetical protein [Candidatus Aenigmarchaeota archaeon]
MPSDGTTIQVKNDDSVGTIMGDLLSEINFKAVFMLFLVFLFIVSDVFMINVLEKINGAVVYKTPTSLGTIIQGTILILSFILLDITTKRGVF